MLIEIDVARFFDWETRHQSEIGPGEIAVAANDLGPNLNLVRVTREQPSTTSVVVPDEDIERMKADHDQAVADAGAGGFPHPVSGELSQPRAIPHKTAKQLLAEHIEQSVMPQHSAQEHWTDVRVPGYPKLERYLRQRLLAGADSADDEVEAIGEAPAPAPAEAPAKEKK